MHRSSRSHTNCSTLTKTQHVWPPTSPLTRTGQYILTTFVRYIGLVDQCLRGSRHVISRPESRAGPKRHGDCGPDFKLSSTHHFALAAGVTMVCAPALMRVAIPIASLRSPDHRRQGDRFRRIQWRGADRPRGRIGDGGLARRQRAPASVSHACDGELPGELPGASASGCLADAVPQLSALAKHYLAPAAYLRSVRAAGR